MIMANDVIIVEHMSLRIGSFYQDRVRFLNYPPFQRDKVWRLRRKQVFIDSLLRRLPINACMLMEDVDEHGAGIYQIIDGQQRLETVVEYLQNGFPTMKEKDGKSGLYTLDPIEPGCTFSQLSNSAQNRLNDYKLTFITFAKEQEEILEEIFARAQEQEPLSVGEQLFIHNSRARQVALALMKHTFWETRYTGRTEHKEKFQAALQIIAIEILGFPVNMQISHQGLAPLNRLVMGEYDDELSETFQNTMWKRLSDIENVFYGASVHCKRDIIPVYQAAYHLDACGFDLSLSSKGCLTKWFVMAKKGKLAEYVRDYRPFAKINFPSVQKDFWEKEYEAIQHVPGLVKKLITNE
jgi:hypothetical protein